MMPFSLSHQSLLQAIFLSGPQAIAAWKTWKSHSDFEDLDWESYQLLPLLHQNLATHGIQDPLMNRMKGVQRLFWCRNQVGLSAVTTAISAVQNAGITIKLITPLWGTDDKIKQGLILLNEVKLQIQPNTLTSILSILEPLGWRSESPNPSVSLDYAGSLHLVHETHPPIVLHIGFGPWVSALELMQSCWHRAESSEHSKVQIWNLADQVLHQAIAIQAIPKPGVQAPHFPLPHLTQFILALGSHKLDWSQLLETSTLHSLLAPLQYGLNLIQKLGISLPMDSDTIISFKTPLIEQWEYHFILHSKSHWLTRGIRRVAQYQRRSHLTAQTDSLPLDLSPEWQILLACSLMHCDRNQVEKIKQLVTQSTDWPKLFQLASHHKVSTIVGKNLEQHVSKVLPEAIRKTVSINQRGNRLRNISLTSVLSKILGLLESIGILAIPYKGPTLTQLAYQDLGIRKFNDLDLLVSPQDFQRTKSFLVTQGYVQKMDFGWEESWHHSRDNIEIDLHRAFAPDKISSIPTYADLVDQLVTISFQEKELENLKTSTMSCEMLFILLAIYMVKDHGAWNFRLYQISDVAALVQNHPELDWNVVLEVGQKKGLMRMILLELQLLNTIYEFDIPIVFKPFYQKDLSIKTLSQAVLQRLAIPADAVPSGFGFAFTLRYHDHYFYLKSRERWRDRIHYVLNWLGEILIFLILPNQADYDLMKLPQWGKFLYYPLHLSRLCWKYINVLLRSQHTAR